jgi:predicted nucleic acid-binding protein
MNAPVFVDTNVLLYALDEREPNKRERARLWRSNLWKKGLGRTSYQVLQEFYVNALRIAPAARDYARAEIRDLIAWKPIAMTAELLESAWKLQDRFRLSFWDATIVAAAKASSSKYLLSEDLQAGQDFGGVTVISPFRQTPEQLP